MREEHAIQLIGTPHRGDYSSIAVSFEKLLVKATTNGWFSDSTQLIGIYYDDPDFVERENLLSFAGLSVGDRKIKVPTGENLEEKVLPGGRFAVLCFKGPYALLEDAYHWLYGFWLKQSGEQIADSACTERYLNSPQDTPSHELLTEIRLPLL